MACCSDTVASAKETSHSLDRPIVFAPILTGQYSPALDFDIEYKKPITGLCPELPDAGKPTYSFSTTHESIDKAREAFRKVKDLTIKLSMVENAAYRLASNIKKTQKRANALQNITIPMYSSLVYTITNALEEKEREEFTRLKVIKRMKEKKTARQ